MPYYLKAFHILNSYLPIHSLNHLLDQITHFYLGCCLYLAEIKVKHFLPPQLQAILNNLMLFILVLRMSNCSVRVIQYRELKTETAKNLPYKPKPYTPLWVEQFALKSPLWLKLC